MIMIQPVKEHAIYQYDPDSQEIVNDIPAKHKNSKKLLAELNSTVAELSQNVESHRSDLHSNLSYEQFMGDMLYHDEIILANGQFIKYLLVKFELLKNKDGPELPEKKKMRRGRAFLTNRRFIMLSSEGICTTAVSGIPSSSVKPKKYSVKCESGDAFHYQYLPLNSIKAVELDALVGASMSTYINSQKPCCLLNMFSCCGLPMCLRNWYEVGRVSNPAFNLRAIKLSVDLPPWGNPCIVTIIIRPEVTLHLVKDVLRDLQLYSPAMKIQTYEKDA